MKLIALCGAAGAGKDTVADILGWRKLAFADVLYAEVAQAFGVSVEWLKRRDFKEVPHSQLCADNCDSEEFVEFLYEKDIVYTEWTYAQPRSPRQILQWWGDYRRAQDPDYFVRLAEIATYDQWATGSDVVITDVRFPNEAALVRQLAGQLWQIRRPGYEAGGTGHKSDVDGGEFEPDRVIVNGGSLDALKEFVETAKVANK